MTLSFSRGVSRRASRITSSMVGEISSFIEELSYARDRRNANLFAPVISLELLEKSSW